MQLEERVEANGGVAYDKWSDWHLDNIHDYSREQITTFCFVVDAMNFCFWPQNPSGQFEYHNMTRNLEKVLKADPGFFSCGRLVEVQADFLKENVFGST